MKCTKIAIKYIMCYDLAGIQGEKIDTFLNGMMNASATHVFQECIKVLKEFFHQERELKSFV